jgi:predicted ATPase
MDGQPSLKSLRLQNLLSFGERCPLIELGPLNVLIGPNASGKSNLIEVIGLLQSAPKDLAESIRVGGGIVEWLWKGATKSATAILDGVVNLSPHPGPPIRYKLSLRRAAVSYQFEIADERIEYELPREGHTRPYMFFGYENGRPIINVKDSQQTDGRRFLQREEINPQQSVLSQRKDLDQYPEITRTGQLFSSFKLYRNWEFGRESTIRDSYGAEGRTDFLEEDGSNLGLMLNRLHSDPTVRPDLLEYIRKFSDEAVDIHTPIQGGFVDVRLEEKGEISIPAIRLSDGTLRWLTLLTILLHPAPPPLVCIEEPELGLHPDMIRPLAQLLREAAKRMQLIITTHSDSLVDEFTETPEDVIVCEKHEGSTIMKKLGREGLSEWLKKYTLGQLWHKGEIGGTRW